ncbi:hypothetical protein [Treponema primitia]|uniref:hypothetical protein n=1 Tax=Treponema primitia TaxID=88058 RepID=UPI001FDF9C13|nr:hypothetical protein [Treponema primitia]
MICLLSLFSCTGKNTDLPAQFPAELPAGEAAIPKMPPVEYGQLPRAILQSGENPLWFELGEDGPALIPSPDEASLTPYIPWPLAQRIAGILAREDRLFLGINREGFLAFAPWAGSADGSEGVTPATNAGIALYQADMGRYWKDYSVDTLFIYGQTPAALLYRDDYFIDTNLPPPSPQVWGLQAAAGTRAGGLEELDIPAFRDLPPEEGWDLEDLREGPDDAWYYRAVKKAGTGRGIGYFHTAALSAPGTQSSPGALQNASQPRPLEQAPDLLRQVLEKMIPSKLSASPEAPGIAAVVSPEFTSLRYYADDSVLGNTQNDILIFPGFYQTEYPVSPENSGGYVKKPLALVISPSGKGFIGINRNGLTEIQELSLPALPAGFVYTGLGVMSGSPGEKFPRTVLASWEEQDGWNVGAAGFVLVGLRE